jgi:hypothetical protein
MSMHQNNKLLLVHDKRCFVSHWPPASAIGMLLITNFLELGMVAGISRTLADRQHAVTLPRPCHGFEKSLSERSIHGLAVERRGMCESNMAALCKSNGKDTI